ncbi:MAG TPA: autotransporter outer membrane beta-barrel domain-containing protein, partial [Aliidongia sp.]|nr:autotransporter outer membrane beta-barrel domain-containing protein [Aliidongia sp.]
RAGGGLPGRGRQGTGDSALIGVGLATAMFANTSVYLRYDGDLDGSSSSHAITAGFRFSW